MNRIQAIGLFDPATERRKPFEMETRNGA